MSDQKNFLGIPIEGDIRHADPRVPQRPIEDLQPILQAVIDDPFITQVKWTQYTPYFNDGEPCEFSVHEVAFLTEGEPENEDDDEDWDEYEHTVQSFSLDYFDKYMRDTFDPNVGLGAMIYDDVEYDRSVNPPVRNYVNKRYIGNHLGSYERAYALATAIGGGEFENVLLEHFGDHATITIHKDRVSVEAYDHD